MKLLTPTENTTEKDRQLAVKLRELASLDSQITLKRKELAKATLELQITIEKQLIQFETDRETYVKELNGLKSEVYNLEVRRKELLLPLDNRWIELEGVQADLNKQKDELATNTSLLNETLESLQERLTDVSDREVAANRLNEKQKVSQAGIKQQRELISKQQKEFNSLVAQSVIDFDIRDRTLSTKESELILKQKTLTDKEQDLIKREQKLIDKDRELADKYATLERTIQRYGKKR